MLYTLLNNNSIVVGPRDWNHKYFEYFINGLGINAIVSETPVTEPTAYSDTVILTPTIQEEVPSVNPLFEVLAGPYFRFENDGKMHIAFYIAQELSIEVVKGNLLAEIANSRWQKEVTAINRDINGKQLTIYMDRGSRGEYAKALSLATDEYSASWKFPEGFVTLNKTDLQTIVNEVASYVQSCFDAEAMKAEEINSKTTVEELRSIVLE